jgi:hypothetical protein
LYCTGLSPRPARQIQPGLQRTDESGQVVRPGDELSLVRRLDAHQRRDHLSRQRPRDGADEVEPFSGVDGIEPFGDQLFDARRQRLQRGRAETRIEDLADAPMVRRIEKEHRAREQALKTPQLAAHVIAVPIDAHDPAAGALRRKARVAKHRLHVGVARHHPGAAEEPLAPVEGPGLAHRVVDRIRVAQEAGIRQQPCRRRRLACRYRAHRPATFIRCSQSHLDR